MTEYRWISDGIFVLREFFTAQECEDYVRLSEELGYGDAPINTTFGPMVRPDVRNNQRVMLDDAARAAELWRRVREFVPAEHGRQRAVGVNERFRFYRDDVGQQFDWHHDGYFERPNGERSLLTFMIYLKTILKEAKLRSPIAASSPKPAPRYCSFTRSCTKAS